TTTIESAPRLSAAAKGKQPSRATTPVEPTDVQRTEAEQLKIILKRSRQETDISQQSGSGTHEGTGSKPGVSNVPSDDSEEELSWKSSDDEDVETVKSGDGKDDDDDDDEDDDDNDEEEERAKDDEEDKETGKGGDEVRKSEGESEEEEETKEEEEGSFDPIPKTPEDSEKESDDEEEQDSRLSEEARIQEEEDVDELYQMELKKILIEKMEGNKSIQQFDEQRTLYKALVEAYEADKAILDTYGDSTILKRRREDDDQEGPFAGPN
nr:hypothetical protein [Tanacetum cinerariifolium]